MSSREIPGKKKTGSVWRGLVVARQLKTRTNRLKKVLTKTLERKRTNKLWLPVV